MAKKEEKKAPKRTLIDIKADLYDLQLRESQLAEQIQVKRAELVKEANALQEEGAKKEA